MNGSIRQPDATDTIKSVTLAELRSERRPLADTAASLAKAALMLWGALSLGAAAGTATYYFVGAAKEPVLVSETTGSIARTSEPDQELTPTLAEIPPHLSEYVAAGSEDAAPAEPEPIVEARLPRPRPDDPIYTGSLERPRHPRDRYADPCEALRALGAPLAFRVRCSRESRVYAPPPPRYYYPQPYQPPYVVR